MYKLSILIPHLKSYDVYYSRLRDVLDPQLTDECQVIVMIDEGQMSIGKKRNWLLNKASGEYVCFIDSDDLISENYIKYLMEGIENGVDCCSLMGLYNVDGGEDWDFFEHSIRYKEYKTNNSITVRNPVKYERFPNHLNCIKASIAKQFTFPEKNHGEDTDWATKLLKSGLLKTEHYIRPVIYHYLYRSKK